MLTQHNTADAPPMSRRFLQWFGVLCLPPMLPLPSLDKLSTDERNEFEAYCLDKHIEPTPETLLTWQILDRTPPR